MTGDDPKRTLDLQDKLVCNTPLICRLAFELEISS